MQVSGTKTTIATSKTKTGTEVKLPTGQKHHHPTARFMTGGLI